MKRAMLTLLAVAACGGDKAHEPSAEKRFDPPPEAMSKESESGRLSSVRMCSGFGMTNSLRYPSSPFVLIAKNWESTNTTTAIAAVTFRLPFADSKPGT